MISSSDESIKEKKEVKKSNKKSKKSKKSKKRGVGTTKEELISMKKQIEASIGETLDIDDEDLIDIDEDMEIDLKEFDIDEKEFKSLGINTDKTIKKLPEQLLEDNWEDIKENVDFDKLNELMKDHKDIMKEYLKEELLEFNKQVEENKIVNDYDGLKKILYVHSICMNYEGSIVYFNSPNDNLLYNFDCDNNRGRIFSFWDF